MPFLSFVAPGGPYAVGQADALWRSGDGRKLVVRIFYPADAAEAERCPKAAWLPETYGGSAVSYAGELLWLHTARCRRNAPRWVLFPIAGLRTECCSPRA